MTQRQNYAATIDLKKKQRIAAGLLSDRFPEVSGIVIQMTYLRKGLNPVLMRRTVNIFPTTYAYFNMDCMIRGCTNGGFDLTPVITDMVERHRSRKKGTLACCGKSSGLPADHASIAYEVTIEFSKESKG